MSPDRTALLRNQFDLIRALAETHLRALTDDDLLWAPTPHHWTVRCGDDGYWRPDWELTDDGTEPDPVPVPTAGWVSWHLGWWWSTTLDHLRNVTPRDREQVYRPGTTDTTIAWLHQLSGEWTRPLDDLDDSTLDAPAPFPRKTGTGYAVADTLA